MSEGAERLARLVGRELLAGHHLLAALAQLHVPVLEHSVDGPASHVPVGVVLRVLLGRVGPEETTAHEVSVFVEVGVALDLGQPADPFPEDGRRSVPS